MDVNPDFKELLQSLSNVRARFLIVGAHAVIYHTEPRYTKDLDVWVEPSPENATRVWKALADFGAPLHDATEADFANPRMVFQMGVEPNRIDIMMGIEGASFEHAWAKRVRSTYGGVPVYILCRTDLVRAKRAAGRPQDLLDVQQLLAKPGWKRRKQKRKRGR